jgi:hypothetical protein
MARAAPSAQRTRGGKRRAVHVWLLCLGPVIAVAATAALACVDERPGLAGTSSLRVVVEQPEHLGSQTVRLRDDDRRVALDIVALDAQGELDPTLSGEVAIFAQYLGSLSPIGHDGQPLRIALEGGTGRATLDLPQVFGPTVLWVEDSLSASPTYATGTSPALWYRDPYLADVSRPVDEMAFAALQRSPLEGKQVEVSGSRHGDDGRLVVTGAYAQGYTLSDVDCARLPCTAGAYDHILVFSFGLPLDRRGEPIEVGHQVRLVAGAVSEFNGLTEIGFPVTELVDGAADERLLPEPVPLDPQWLVSPTGADGMINLERLESALVEVQNATICPPDRNFERYGQWKLDVGLGCRRSYNVVSHNTVPAFDPTAVVGARVTRVVGTLRAVNIDSFHVWIVEARRASDIELASPRTP